MALFQKGNTLGGKPKGTKNRYNRDIRQIFHEVYDAMGEHITNDKTGKPLTGHDAMLIWARDNPTEFYRLYGKMIPAAAEAKDDGHEDFIDDLVFVDEQPMLVEAKDVTNKANDTKVGSKDHERLISGEHIPRIDTDIPPPGSEAIDVG